MDSSMLGRVLSRMAARTLAHSERTCPAGVTIAIPNWNHEYLLPRSVGSAMRALRELRAHDVPAEALVVDDQSRDGSLTLLRQLEALYFDEGLRVLALPRNGGPSVTRNHALMNATYRHIVFMDADNEIVPGNLYQFYRAIAQTHAAVVYGNLLGSLVRQEETVDEDSLFSNESFQMRQFDGNHIDTFALFDRLQMLDTGGFIDSLMVEAHEDWELYLHLAVNGRRIVFVPLVFGIYHTVPGSLTDEMWDSYPAQKKYIQRVFNQLGIREKFILNTRHLRYHPDIGYL